MTANDTSIDARDWSLLGLLSILWGGSFFFNGVVLKELPPFTVVFLRVTLAAHHAAAAAVALPHPLPGRLVRLAAVHRHRASQQRAAVLADRGRADLYPGRAGLDPERHDAAVHGGRDGGRGRGKAARAADRGRRRRPGRRDHSPWRWLWTGARAGPRHPALPCGRLLLRTVGAAGATAAVEFPAARHRDVPDAGLGRDDDRCRRARRTSLAVADAGRYRHGSP